MVSASPSAFQNRMHRLLQSLLLSIPFLSQMRLANGRVMAFLRVWHFAARAGVRGDYLEFGTWEGMSFALSLRAARKFFARGDSEAPRFFAFDSFQGLSDPTPRDGELLARGQYSATRRTFESRIRKARKGFDVRVIPGFFHDSLTPSVLQEHKITHAAFVTIDCDLYEPTLDALNFIHPVLQTGTVIYFDDWFLFHGDMQSGEAGACNDWLKQHPEITLVDFGSVGVMGKMFLVNLPKP